MLILTLFLNGVLNQIILLMFIVGILTNVSLILCLLFPSASPYLDLYW